MEILLFVAIAVLLVVFLSYVEYRQHEAETAFRQRQWEPSPISTPLIASNANLPLHWVKAASKEWPIHRYELYSDLDLLAILWLAHDGAFLEAETFEGRWIGTFADSALKVWLEPSDVVVAIIADCGRGVPGNKISFRNGHVYRLHREMYTISRTPPEVLPILWYSWEASTVTDKSGQRLMTFRADSHRVEIDQAAWSLPQLTPLLLLALAIEIQLNDFQGE